MKTLSRHLKGYDFETLTASDFPSLWRRGKLKGKPIYFASWRIPFNLARSERCLFNEADFQRFMASVTSHYNIGGGLDPQKALHSGADVQAAYEAAVAMIKKFKVVTVNSKILHDLLSPMLPGLIYAPNGVDAAFFSPEGRKEYEPGRIRIGWVGKVKAAKNYDVVDQAFARLREFGIEGERVALSKSTKRNAVLSKERMRDFYRSIDYYLCTSWHEGTPNPALEAAACGVPVLTTRVGNMPELIREGRNGFFIEPRLDSIMELVSRIRDIGKEAYGSLSSAARSSILEDWLWEKRVEIYGVAFERLLDGGSAG